VTRLTGITDPSVLDTLSPTELEAEIKLAHREAEDHQLANRWDDAMNVLTAIDLAEKALDKQTNVRERIEHFRVVAEARRKPTGSHTQPDPDELARNGGHFRERKSLGKIFTESDAYRIAVRNGAFNSTNQFVPIAVPIPEGRSLVQEAKAILIGSDDTSGGGFVLNQFLPGLKVPILQRQLTILDLIPTTPTTSDTIDWVRESTFTNAAAPTAEATASTGTSGTAPESALAYARTTSPVQNVEHYVTVTNRMLADYPAIEGIINQRLLLGLNLTLENQILTGNGTAPNLTGILSTAGVGVQARGATDNNMEAVFKGMMQVMVTGLSVPNAVVMHPLNFQTIRLVREGTQTGQYLYGPPSQTGATTIWGLPLIMSLGLAANTALTGDFAMGLMLWDREQSTIRTGYINDDLIRGIQRILAEIRVALTVFRGAAFCQVTGLA
jgi:HK97 family phage major capsid protein